MLEGAILAVKVLDRLCVHGRPIKVAIFSISFFPFCIKIMFKPSMFLIFQVQRPVHGSVLDLDLNLEALMSETLNSNNLYAVKLSGRTAQRLNISPKTNGLMAGAQCAAVSSCKTVNGLQSAKLNGETLDLPSSSELSEETVRETFSRFGTVESIILPAKPTKHAGPICISEWKS